VTAPTGTAFSARERWTLVGASLWLVIGLQLDAYAHATTPELETFWTPWHGVLYSGIAACGFTLLWLLRPRLPRVLTYRRLRHDTPSALRLPVVGMAMLLVGGAIDTLWHNLFGIEKGLEIFFSPSHFLIIGGMTLVASGPGLMLASESPARTLSARDAAMVTVSALLAVLPLHIYSLHANALAAPLLGTGDDPMRTFSLDGQMVHGYFGSTVLLLLPLLILGRRWRLPVGVPTLLVGLPGLLLMLMFGDPGEQWLPLTVGIAGAAAEVLARSANRIAAGLSAETRWLLMGFLSPAVVWGAVLLVGNAVVGVGWNLHIVTGVLAFAALTGLGTSFVIRRIEVAAPRAVAAS
jgi:hypothetical protein